LSTAVYGGWATLQVVEALAMLGTAASARAAAATTVFLTVTLGLMGTPYTVASTGLAAPTQIATYKVIATFSSAREVFAE
jgi:hypothetical protein